MPLYLAARKTELSHARTAPPGNFHSIRDTTPTGSTDRSASLLQIAGLDWAVPGCMTLCRSQKTLAVQIPYRRADTPLNLLVFRV